MEEMRVQRAGGWLLFCGIILFTMGITFMEYAIITDTIGGELFICVILIALGLIMIISGWIVAYKNGKIEVTTDATLLDDSVIYKVVCCSKVCKTLFLVVLENGRKALFTVGVFEKDLKISSNTAFVRREGETLVPFPDNDNVEEGEKPSEQEQ